MYGEIVSSDIALTDEKYVILSDHTALFTANYIEELSDMKERVHYSKGFFTFVLKMIDDQWMIVHMHTSSYPIKKAR